MDCARYGVPSQHIIHITSNRTKIYVYCEPIATMILANLFPEMRGSKINLFHMLFVRQIIKHSVFVCSFMLFSFSSRFVFVYWFSFRSLYERVNRGFVFISILRMFAAQVCRRRRRCWWRRCSGFLVHCWFACWYACHPVGVSLTLSKLDPSDAHKKCQANTKKKCPAPSMRSIVKCQWECNTHPRTHTKHPINFNIVLRGPFGQQFQFDHLIGRHSEANWTRPT